MKRKIFYTLLVLTIFAIFAVGCKKKEKKKRIIIEDGVPQISTPVTVFGVREDRGSNDVPPAVVINIYYPIEENGKKVISKVLYSLDTLTPEGVFDALMATHVIGTDCVFGNLDIFPENDESYITLVGPGGMEGEKNTDQADLHMEFNSSPIVDGEENITEDDVIDCVCETYAEAFNLTRVSFIDYMQGVIKEKKAKGEPLTERDRKKK